MIVRKAHPEDAQAMTDILNEVITIGGTTAYQTPKQPAYFDRFFMAADSKTFLHVAEVGGEILGMQWMSPDDTGMGVIATFAKPGTVQRGIGTALFAATKQSAINAGYTLLDATIRADNTGGLAYYSKMGFQDHSVTKAAPLSDGTLVDRIHKRMTL